MSDRTLRPRPHRASNPPLAKRRSPRTRPPSTPLVSLPSASGTIPSGLVTIPSRHSRDGALTQIEHMLECMIDAMNNGSELSIPYRSIRSTQGNPALTPSQREGHPNDMVRFPAQTLQETRKFEALFCILELAHEALLSGKLITLRNIYYQNMELFGSQGVVNVMVDSLASTLGVGRWDLNIVATAKGLISGPVELLVQGCSIIHCGLPRTDGILLPSINSIEKINFHSVKWVLVIEKEATFRTLAASQYHQTSKAGHGILITAKGYPDLATRRFLNILHSVRPQLHLFALVDFDPHGIAILRTYMSGSKRFGHEENITLPSMEWLGIRSRDIMTQAFGKPTQTANSLPSSQEARTRSYSEHEQQLAVELAHDVDAHATSHHGTLDPVNSTMALTQTDRKKAVSILNDICTGDGTLGTAVSMDEKQELQRMLVLNVKADIQAVDHFGDITSWLDEKL
ncbi:Spo11/DNA topoisomerase VI subunit A, partial [Podospora appendiculata]